MGGQTQHADLDRRTGGSAIAILRRETRIAHRRLELELDVLRVDLSMDEYRAMLVGFARLHQALDHGIGVQLERAQMTVAELGIDEWRRTPSLERDLRLLGIDVPGPMAFPLTSLAGALGALYVSEGSKLGGQVIAPHIRAVLGPHTPVAFFESSGAAAQAQWAASRATIDRLLIDGSERCEAARVAVAVFECLAEVLRR